MKRLLLVLSLVLVLGMVGCDLFSEAPPYTTENFTVPPGEKYTVAVELDSGHTVEGSFSVSGAQNDIDFYIEYTTGLDTTQVYGVDRAQGGYSFELKALKSGTYVLYFDNSFGFGSSRQISLQYRTR
jgi:hypothetical protein